MIRIKDEKFIREMGFVKNDDEDYIYREMVDGSPKTLFTIYAGSPYLRYSRTAYASNNQIRCIYEWTKKNYIEWED